jgi:hypothetical protein
MGKASHRSGDPGLRRFPRLRREPTPAGGQGPVKVVTAVGLRPSRYSPKWVGQEVNHE